MTRVSLSELSRRLQAGKASIVDIRNRGVIQPGVDGLYDLEESLRKIAARTSGHGGGWDSGRAKKSLRERAQALLASRPAIHIQRPAFDDPKAEAYRALFDAILGRRNLVPGILAKIGVKDPVLLAAADDIFAALVCSLSGGLEDVAYDWESGLDDIPLVQTDLEPIFRHLKIRLTCAIKANADKMAEAADGAIQKALKDSE